MADIFTELFKLTTIDESEFKKDKKVIEEKKEKNKEKPPAQLIDREKIVEKEKKKEKERKVENTKLSFEKESLSNLKSKDIIKGIIMKEVLDRPRSRNPYRAHFWWR